MLSNLLSDLQRLSKDIDIQDYLDLDERCLEILFFLYINASTKFNHNQLRKRLNDFGFNFQEPLYTKRLDILEEKKIINRKRNGKTIITINTDPEINNDRIIATSELTLDLLDKVKKNILEFNDVEDIFEDLKRLYIEKGSASLAFKIGYLNKQLSLKERNLGYIWANILYEYVIDLYLERVEEMGLEAISELAYLYRKTIPKKED